MLVVNNSKNPAHGAKPLAKYSKVGEERVLVVITARTRAGGYVLLLGIASSCILAPENHMDVLKTRCEEQARCNSPLCLDRGVGVCFGKARSHPHAASRSPLLMTVSARCRLPKHGRKLTRLSLASAELPMER